MQSLQETTDELVALYEAQQSIACSFQAGLKDADPQLLEYLHEEQYGGLDAETFLSVFITDVSDQGRELQRLTRDVVNFKCRWSKAGCGTDLGS